MTDVDPELLAKAAELDTKKIQFTTEAVDEAKALAKQFGKDLAAESERIARRSSAASISEAYVKEAGRRLGQIDRKWGQASLTAGGILFGGGLSGFISMGAANAWPGQGLALSIVATVVGAFLLGQVFSNR